MPAGYPRLQLATLRVRLVKIGGWVRERVQGVTVHLASSHPGEPLWRLLATHSLTLMNDSNPSPDYLLG